MNISIISLRIAVLCVALPAAAGCAAGDTGVSEPIRRWEVIVGASGKPNGNGWKVALPYTEIEYRWSERLALVSNNSWAIVNPDSGPATSGLGTAELGFKWLFWDDPDNEFSMALCPQLARSISRTSVQRGVISADKEFALATETTFTAAGMAFEIKAGRNVIEHAADEWMLEVKAARACLPNGECNLTVERNFVPMEPQRTLVKAGIDWKINDSLTLQSALGRDVGPSGTDRKDRTASIGLKFKF